MLLSKSDVRKVLW